MNDQQIEQEIQAKGLTAPRVTPAASAICCSEVRETPRAWNSRSAASSKLARVACASALVRRGIGRWRVGGSGGAARRRLHSMA